MNLVRACFLLVYELVLRYVPICRWLFQSSFKDHFSLDSPNLKQEFVALVFVVDDFHDLWVDDFDQNRTEVRTFLVLAASNYFVKFFQWNLIHDHVHVLLSRGKLILVKPIFFMLVRYEFLQIFLFRINGKQSLCRGI